jgi:hypothetical protein
VPGNGLFFAWGTSSGTTVSSAMLTGPNVDPITGKGQAISGIAAPNWGFLFNGIGHNWAGSGYQVTVTGSGGASQPSGIFTIGAY